MRLLIDLPLPHKLLWPNGSRGSYRAVAGEKKKHGEWAYWTAHTAAKSAGWSAPAGELPVHLVVHAKPKGPLPDKDNCIAAIKTYQDSIASALGLNDRTFAAPTVEFSPLRNSRFVIVLGGDA